MKKTIFTVLLVSFLVCGCASKIQVTDTNQILKCEVPPEPVYKEDGKPFMIEDLYIANKLNVAKLGYYLSSEKEYKEKLQNIIRNCYEAQTKKNKEK